VIMKLYIIKSVTLNFIKVLLIVFFFTSALISQNKTGTTIGQFLKIEPSSRIAAMGNAGVSLYGGATVGFYNPASLGRLTHADLEFTYNKWIADILYNYAIVAFNIENFGTISLQVTSLNSGEIDVRTVEQPLGTGERYTVSNLAFGLSYGLMLTEKVSVGFTISYINESIWHSNLNAFSVNVGVQYEIAGTGAILGASVSNFGPRASFDGRDLFVNYDFDPKKFGDNDQVPAQLRTDLFSLPTIFRVGVSYPMRFTEDYNLTVAVDAIHPNDNNESVNIGGELNLLKNFSIRGGYRNLFLSNAEGGLVLGAGVNVDFSENYSINFDYAWADYGRLEQAHRLTLGFSF